MEKIKKLTKLVQDTGKTGFYFRVVQHGEVKPSDSISLYKAAEQRWTIEACNELAISKGDPEDYLNLSTFTALSGNWKDSFYRKYKRFSESA